MAAGRKRQPARSTSPDRVAFAARVRVARAALGLNQTQLATCVGVTQRAVHQIERGAVAPRKATEAAIEDLFERAGLKFELLKDGGFNVCVPRKTLVRRRPSSRKLD
jgi:DNA-binding XRE family transcriptional regulator